MFSVRLLIRSQIVILAPFLNSLLVYFVIIEDAEGQLWTTTLKCAPIALLMLYMYLKGFDFSERYHRSQRILLGLIFSCIGDALLNIDTDLFAHGMTSFAVAQICYISAFGWKPLKLVVGIPLYTAGAILLSVLFEQLDGVLVAGLPLYVALLLTMCWRALTRALTKWDFLSASGAVGSLLFVLSDSLIAIDMFLVNIPHARIWIMSTYYAAQFAIALSTAAECRILKLSPKQSQLSVPNRSNGSGVIRNSFEKKEK